MSDTLAAVLRAAGLPVPLREHRFAPPRRWRFDYAWPAHRLALEIEGGTWTGGRHVRGSGYEADCEKYSEAALRGWRVLRVTTAMLRDGRALAMLERALSAGAGEGPVNDRA
jgi:very-short-patch-repair endonuclease